MITPSGIPDLNSPEGSFVEEDVSGGSASIVTPIRDARDVAYARGKRVRSLDCQFTVIASAQAIPVLRVHEAARDLGLVATVMAVEKML